MNFTGTSELKGGDLVTGMALSENLVNLSDYLVLKANWYTYNSIADITGDGSVDLDDYFILYLNWFTRGDNW